MSETDFMTEREKRLEARRQRVAAAFKEMRAKYPDLAPSRIAERIAAEEALSVPGVMYILRRCGAWEGRRDG